MVTDYLRLAGGRLVKGARCALLSTVLLAQAAQAAVVTLGTPPASPLNSNLYNVGGQDYSVFANLTDTNAAFGDNPGGEELLWLGAHTSWAAPLSGTVEESGVDPSNVIQVNLASDSPGSSTGPVSLVLSSAENIDWDINVSADVQLNNIFVISLGNETHGVDINDLAASLAPGANTAIGAVNVRRSDTESACGYEYPGSSPSQGCDSQSTLGLAMNGAFAFVNELDALQGANPLKLSSFSGSYYVNQFDVTVAAAQVIPVPAAAGLFGLALACLGAGNRILFRGGGIHPRNGNE